MIARTRAWRELHPRQLPRRAWLMRLVDAQCEHGAKFSHAQILHQPDCGVARGGKCDCDIETFVHLKCGKVFRI
jgi:hypothetical protein